MTVANHLKEIRKSRGLHQKYLANATGFSSKTIGCVEREECPPSGEFMLRMAQYFHLVVEDIFYVREN